MDGMTLQEEWLSQILGKSTRQSYTMGMRYFLEFLGLKKCEDIKEIEKPETRVMQFYQWLQDKKGLSSNSAVARCVAIQSFFSYIERPLRLKHKLPQTTMKIETWRPSVENLQKVFSLGDICVKCWMSLSRDIPQRISDMMKITDEQIQSGDFMIISQKEKVPGRCFTSERTREFFKDLKTSGLSLPKTARGIDKMMAKACEIAGMPKRINQHLWRKLFTTRAIDEGLTEIVWKVLICKKVSISDRTYWLEGDRLKPFWERVVNGMPLEAKNGNGRVNNLEQAIGNLEAENIGLKTRIDQMQKTLITIGRRLEEYDRMLNEALKS